MGAYQHTIRPNGLPALLRRAGDCTAAPIRAIASFLHEWAAVKRCGASRFGYSAGAFRVLCHAFRCCDSIAVPIFPLFSPPGCSINPSKSVVERPIPAAPSARARRPPTLGQFCSVEIQARTSNDPSPFPNPASSHDYVAWQIQAHSHRSTPRRGSPISLQIRRLKNHAPHCRCGARMAQQVSQQAIMRLWNPHAHNACC
jgi:hypothetical protein